MAALAAALAVPLLILAVNLAAYSLEPYTDSGPVFLAGMATVLMAGAAGLLMLPATELARLAWQDRLRGFEPIVYGAAALMLSAPLAKAATNDLQASSIGQGGPSFALICIGALGLGLGLTSLMTQRREYGILAVVALGALLQALAV